MVLSQDPSIEELKEVAQKHPDLEITKDDSLLAGNCESGTDDFIEAYLEGKTTVKVSDLAPYIEDYWGVRIVLIYKFRQLEQGGEKSEAKPEKEIEDDHPF